MRESIHLHRDFLCTERADQVEVRQCDYVYWPFRLFSSQTQSFQEFYFSGWRSSEAVIGYLVACGARMSIDKHTDRQTDQVLYACELKVNNCWHQHSSGSLFSWLVKVTRVKRSTLK